MADVDLLPDDVREMLGDLFACIRLIEIPYPGIPSYLIVWEKPPKPELMDALENDGPAFWQRFGRYESRFTGLKGQRASLLTLRVPERAAGIDTAMPEVDA